MVLLKKGMFTTSPLQRFRLFNTTKSSLTRLFIIVLSPTSTFEPSGTWDSIHVFEAAERGRQAHYKLTSTIMLHMVDRLSTSNHHQDKSLLGKDKDEKVDVKRDGEVNLSGSMTRQVCMCSCPPPSQLLWCLQGCSRIYLVLDRLNKTGHSMTRIHISATSGV